MSQKLAYLITATAGVSSLRRRTMRKRSALRKTVTLMAPLNDIPSSSDTDSSEDCILIDADTKHAKKGCPFVMELSDSEDERDSVKSTVEMAVSGVVPSVIDISDGGSDDASDVSKRHVLIDVSGGDSDGEGVEQENHGPGMPRLKVGQRLGMPRLVEGHIPGITGLEEGQRPGMPRLEEGQRPWMPRLEEGQRHGIPRLEVRLTRIDEVMIELEDKVDHRERVCQKEDGEQNQPRHERTGVKEQGCITGESTGGARSVRGAQCLIDVDNNQLKRQRLGMRQKVCLLSGCAGGAMDVDRTKQSCTKENNEVLKHKACELDMHTACIVKDSRSNAISGCGRITRNRLSCNVCGKLLTSKFEQEQHRFMHILDQAKSVDVIYVEPPSGMKILPCQINNADPKLYFHDKCCTNICNRKDYLKKAGDRPKLQKMAGDRDKIQTMAGDRDKIQTMAGERDKLQMTYDRDKYREKNGNRDESQTKMGGSKMNVMRVKETVAKRDGGVRQDLQDLTSNSQCVNYIDKNIQDKFDVNEESDGNKSYRCKFCNFHCRIYREIVDHVTEQVAGFTRRDMDVIESAKTAESAKAPDGTYRCKYCSYVTTIKSHFVRHVPRMHIRLVRCEQCGVSFTCRELYSRHKFKHIEERSDLIEYIRVELPSSTVRSSKIANEAGGEININKENTAAVVRCASVDSEILERISDDDIDNGQ